MLLERFLFYFFVIDYFSLAYYFRIRRNCLIIAIIHWIYQECNIRSIWMNLFGKIKTMYLLEIS